ncbi:MAG TPA: tetratricopeptide repeat protein [Longimicrobiales bacterium]|nr:tetratricopeptide repeat protein [Longimicrobiales bacterium]
MELKPLLERALSLADEGDWEAMAELLRGHLAEFEEEAAVHLWLGVAERELGMGGIAYERFKRALALNPEDPYVLATAGNGVAAYDDEDAEAALRTAALIAPDIALTRMLYGAYLAREGLVAEALKELEVASKLDPDDAQIAYELGVARYLVEDVDGAIDSMADAVRLNPEDGWPRSVLGLVLLEAERFEEAAGELSEAAHHRPEDVEIQAAAALAAGIIENDALAYEMLERARIRADEGDTDLLLAAEDRLDAGPEPCRTFLMDEVAPELLRRRLQERP